MHSHADLVALQAQAERRTTPCGDGDLVWHLWGPPDAPPVLLLHGGSGSWTHWVRNIPALLRDGRRVIVPDMPGFGDSAAPPDGQDADVLPGWMEASLAAMLGERALDAAAFSFGALVAGIWATQTPQRFSRLVLVGAPGLSNEPSRRLALRDWQGAPHGPRRLAIHRHNLRELMLATDDAADDFATGLHAANMERDRLRKRRLMMTDLLARQLPGLQCPVSSIYGEADALYFDRWPLIARVMATAPQLRAHTLIPGAGHWVQFEAAAAFDALLRDALAA